MVAADGMQPGVLWKLYTYRPYASLWGVGILSEPCDSNSYNNSNRCHQVLAVDAWPGDVLHPWYKQHATMHARLAATYR
jgi:hypothetical protein